VNEHNAAATNTAIIGALAGTELESASKTTATVATPMRLGKTADLNESIGNSSPVDVARVVPAWDPLETPIRAKGAKALSDPGHDGRAITAALPPKGSISAEHEQGRHRTEFVMKKALIVIGVVAALGTVWGVAPAAGAGPSNDVTVTLSCDKGVSAQASVTVLAPAGNGSLGDGNVPLSCNGGDKSLRQTLPMTSPPTAYVVTMFNNLTTGEQCASTDLQPLGAKVDCGSGRGAKLVAR